MKATSQAARQAKPRPALLRRLGQVGVLFFLVKGMLWLALPAVMIMAGKS